MLFFDPLFIVLFSFFYIGYSFAKGRTRLVLILLFSYIFYAWFDWRFLFLLIASTLVDFYVSNSYDKAKTKSGRFHLLLISIVVNIGVLATFKYFDFFLENIYALQGLGDGEKKFLAFIIPPGISFYTFQTLAYSIDVYNRKQKPEKDLLSFACYVAFFPQLVAGPIERPARLLPQIKSTPSPKLENLYYGVRLFSFGLFKKLFIADNLASISDPIFADPGNYSGSDYLLAAYCFTLQIYCDFSGYTDMARGLAKSLGINLSINFKNPYFSASLSEFWRRWHITLSSWLRDYVYIPLGGSKGGTHKQIRNLLLTFGLSGLWHGASWSFILWGLMHGIIVSAEVAAKKVWPHFQLHKFIAIFLIFHIVVLLWIPFRADDIGTTYSFITGIFNINGSWLNSDLSNIYIFAFYALPLIVWMTIQYALDDKDFDLRVKSPIFRGLFIGIILSLAIIGGSTNEAQFIYFQF